MNDTPNLNLPYIMASQAQKHVTHNDAIRALDAIVQIAVRDKDGPAPPDTPADGDRYIVPADATGVWTGYTDAVAAFQDGAWAFYPPNEGWLAWVADENMLYAYDGTGWSAFNAVNPVALVGVNALAEAGNRLSVSSPAALFNHEGAGHRLAINKAAGEETASLLFQSDFAGHAEIGLAGDNDLHIKVSPDGEAWHEALVVDGTTRASKFSAPIVLAGETTSDLLRHEANTLDAHAGNFHFNCAAFAGVNEPTSARSNVVWTLGYNVDAGGGRVDGDEPTLALHFETFYVPTHPGAESIEWHLQSEDVSGALHRPLSFLLPRDGTKAHSFGSIHANVLSLGEYDFTQRVKFDFNSGTVDFDDLVLRFPVNNAPVLRQRNAEDTAFLDLPYFDDGNKLILTGRQQHNIGAIPAGQSGYWLPLNPGAAGHASAVVKIDISTQTNAEVYGFSVDGSSNWRILTYLRNTHASGYAQATLAAAGPAFNRYTDEAGTDWSVGKNAEDHFFIGNGDPGTNTALIIDKESLGLTFGKPPRLPSFAVSELPGAAAYPAGSLIFVTDETDGPVPAFSDGSSWRRMTDRTIVS